MRLKTLTLKLNASETQTVLNFAFDDCVFLHNLQALRSAVEGRMYVITFFFINIRLYTEKASRHSKSLWNVVIDKMIGSLRVILEEKLAFKNRDCNISGWQKH